MQITISNNNYSNSFYALIPKSDYKGPVLKLTKKDKQQIAQLEKQILEYRLDMYEYQKYKDLKKVWTEKDQLIYSCKGLDKQTAIEYLEKRIKEIKTNRLKKQIGKN